MVDGVYSQRTQRLHGLGTGGEGELVGEHMPELDAQAIAPGRSEPAVPVATVLALQVELVGQLPVGHGSARVSDHEVERADRSLVLEDLHVAAHDLPAKAVDHSPCDQGLEGQAQLAAVEALLEGRPDRAGVGNEAIESGIVCAHQGGRAAG